MAEFFSFALGWAGISQQGWESITMFSLLFHLKTELPEVLPTSISQLKFDEPTEVWVDFVMKNRTQRNFNHDYDIVYGPVANDRVYAAFALYESDLLRKKD